MVYMAGPMVVQHEQNPMRLMAEMTSAGYMTCGDGPDCTTDVGGDMPFDTPTVPTCRGAKRQRHVQQLRPEPGEVNTGDLRTCAPSFACERLSGRSLCLILESCDGLADVDVYSTVRSVNKPRINRFSFYARRTPAAIRRFRSFSMIRAKISRHARYARAPSDAAGDRASH
jgi:hypothetical protein